MKMITDEDLTLLYYGEHEDPALAVTVAVVDAPSAPQAQSASLLGATLITIGLTLLTLVILGFLGI